MQFRCRIISPEKTLYLENIFRKAAKRNVWRCINTHVQFCIIWLSFLSSSYLFGKTHSVELYTSLLIGNVFPFTLHWAVVCLALLGISSVLSSIHTVLTSIHTYYRVIQSSPLSLFSFSSSTQCLYSFCKLQYICPHLTTFPCGTGFRASPPDFPLHPEFPCIQPFSLSCSRKSSTRI